MRQRVAAVVAATPAGLRHPQAPRRSLSTAAPSGRPEHEDVDAEAMTRRPAKFIPDHLTPMPSRLLTTLLSDLVPQPPSSPQQDAGGATPSSHGEPLPQGHHLVYFPLQAAASRLAADGADRDHSPGPRWPRRLWAGGELVWRRGWRERLRVDGRAWACRETLERATPVPRRDGAGKAEEAGGFRAGVADKVLVDVWRRYGLGHGDGPRGEWDIEERRTLVFLPALGSRAPASAQLRRPLRYPHAATVALAVAAPTPAHLFHFSALTYNAHAIHIDPLYAGAADGHRGLLVHGPLTLALMLRVLARVAAADESPGLASSSASAAHPGRVRKFTYRNYAPLYVGEGMRVCARPVAPRRWDVWIEGPDGGLAVKGSAEMEDD